MTMTPIGAHRDGDDAAADDDDDEDDDTYLLASGVLLPCPCSRHDTLDQC